MSSNLQKAQAEYDKEMTLSDRERGSTPPRIENNIASDAAYANGVSVDQIKRR